jgi:3-oxoisoapionate kinase
LSVRRLVSDRRGQRASAWRSRGTQPPYCTFYGDDFTGSTDALWQFAQFGLRTRLFLSSPGQAAIPTGGCSDLDVVGIAGVARSLPTEALESELFPILQQLRSFDPTIVQFKICSTLDSSASVGNLGRVIEIGREVFGDAPIPIVPAQPDFGRFTIFGNHFATFGADIHRLDRHPTMSVHPITPIHEADICRLLASQASVAGDLIDIRTVRSQSPSLLSQEFERRANEVDFVVFDALSNADLRLIAECIWRQKRSLPHFVVGSGGISRGIAEHIAAQVAGSPASSSFQTHVAATERVLAVSGSCSLQTAEQIKYALSHGWSGIRLEIPSLLQAPSEPDALESLQERMLAAMQNSHGVILYTARGPRDDSIEQTRDVVGQFGLPEASVLAAIGRAFARAIKGAVRHAGITRIVVAGGDTSGWTVRELGAESLEVIGLVAAGGPLCLLSSADPSIDGLEVLLKGGQVGSDGLFEDVRLGRLMYPMSDSAADLGKFRASAGATEPTLD